MRVCYVTERARAVGGWGRYTTEVVRAVRRQGVEPVLASADPIVERGLEDIEHHVVVPALFTRRFETPRSLLIAPRLARVLATCDVVHGVVERYMPLVALARRRGQPYVQTAHGTWAVRAFHTMKDRALFGPALRRVNLLVCQSRFTRDALARLTPLPPHVVLPGGVRLEDFAESSATRLPAWADRGSIVLGVGAIKARKGFDVLLQAVALVRREHTDVRLVIVGRQDGRSAYGRTLEDLADRLGMRDAFHVVGDAGQEDLSAWYHRADVCALLPRSDDGSFEGLGLVYLEAAAAGTPSIGTYGCGAEEAIVNGETGLLVPQSDPESAAVALARLLDDRALRERMAVAARARAATLSWDRLASALVQHYRRLVGQQTSRVQ